MKKGIIWGSFFLCLVYQSCLQTHGLAQIHTEPDIWRLFSKSTTAIATETEQALHEAELLKKEIIDIPARNKTFENTCKALDYLTHYSDLAILNELFRVMINTHSDEAVQVAARIAKGKIDAFMIDVWTDTYLYNALRVYNDQQARHEQLDDEQTYYLEKTLQRFQKEGAHLLKSSELKVIKKDLDHLCQAYLQNVSQDDRSFVITEQELVGVSDTFLSSLPQHEDRTYIIKATYPNYSHLLAHCLCEDTRRQIYRSFLSRAYPQNVEILKKIMQKRDAMVRMLGYESFAHWDLSDQMAQTPERARAFISNLFDKMRLKAEHEFKAFTQRMPESVILEHDHLKPWDFELAKDAYIQRVFGFDGQAFAAYFPMESTLNRMLEMYQRFFSIRMELIDQDAAWHKDIKLVRVSERASEQVLGYIVLDLYPRNNKFSHFWTMPIIPSIMQDTQPAPALVVIVGNFPPPTEDIPSLLPLDHGGRVGGLKTLFHELGHGLHTILGRTKLASLSGMNVPMDFIEMPSSMLEHWIWDADILRSISSHWQTGKHLPDDLLEEALSLKHAATGHLMLKLTHIAFFALELFDSEIHKDIHQTYRTIKKIVYPHILFDEHDRMYTSFIHLADMYYSKLYSYAWSKVLASDLFAYIKKHGLCNPKIGDKYLQEIIGKGGGADPNELLRTFLGREPSDEAFFKDMGL